MDEIYQEKILEHYKNPKNNKLLILPTHSAREANHVCGDIIEIHLREENGTIVETGFKGKGCALSIASASIITEYIKGKTKEQIQNLQKDDITELLNSQVPKSREECITLSLRAIKNAINKSK